MFPDFKTLPEVAVVTPVSSVARGQPLLRRRGSIQAQAGEMFLINPCRTINLLDVPWHDVDSLFRLFRLNID